MAFLIPSRPDNFATLTNPRDRPERSTARQLPSALTVPQKGLCRPAREKRPAAPRAGPRFALLASWLRVVGRDDRDPRDPARTGSDPMTWEIRAWKLASWAPLF